MNHKNQNKKNQGVGRLIKSMIKYGYNIFSFFGIAFIFFSCKRINKTYSDKDVFRYNEHSNITSLDPAFARDQRNIWAVNQLFNGLVRLDDSLRVQPDIAKSWSISSFVKIKSAKTFS